MIAMTTSSSMSVKPPERRAAGRPTDGKRSANLAMGMVDWKLSPIIKILPFPGR